jgi:hypothetical protein
MKTQQIEDKWENARSQAQAQFESIREMVENLERADELRSERDDMDGPWEDAQNAIQEDALSVEVRSGWRCVSAPEGSEPAEYRILLCTGGPAVQITGKLNQWCEPETAWLEMQDWFLPWTEYRPTNEADHTFASRIDTKAEEILLVYARQFYFGE